MWSVNAKSGILYPLFGIRYRVLGMADTTLILKRIFPGLDGPDLEALRQVVVRRFVPAETVICHEGQIEHEFYIISEGRVVISKQFADGQEHVLAVKGAGEFFGEMALVEDKPRTATVTALVETELLSITEETFDQVVARSPIVALTILREVSRTLRQADHLTIVELERKHNELQRAYRRLQAAQVELLEKQLLDRELEIAAEVQRNILPTRFPAVPGFSCVARAQPARQVGGDFYDIRLVAGDKLGVLSADVSGKSVHAAIFMAITRGLFLAEALRSESPGEVMCRVHELLMEIAGVEGMFVTAFYAVIDPHSGRMRYARAGHDRPLLCRQGAVRVLPGSGRFLGMFDGLTIDERELQLLPGDLLVLFSDGVTDAVNVAGEQFGLKRLSRIVRDQAPTGAQTVCDVIFNSVLDFQGAASQFDDITLQVIAYEGNETRGR
jgi:sigma-B regulation protein RsbU (phosphoserine phosphatase)